MTLKVELVYFEGCPHAETARVHLRRALEARGLPPSWQEWDSGAHQTPPAYRGYASPTVLVNDRPVGGGVAGPGTGCAVGGAPSVALILTALPGGEA
jgi:hypothetical protein